MMRPLWSGTITFGLVSVPVDMYPANRSDRAPLRMLSPDGVPLSRRYYSRESGRDLDDDQMIRGYEIEKGKYIVVTDDELEKLAPRKSRDIDLRRFVDEQAIPPIYFERGYYLTPGAEASRDQTSSTAANEEIIAVRVPAAGIVQTLSVRAGQMVATGQPVATLISNS